MQKFHFHENPDADCTVAAVARLTLHGLSGKEGYNETIGATVIFDSKIDE